MASKASRARQRERQRQARRNKAILAQPLKRGNKVIGWTVPPSFARPGFWGDESRIVDRTVRSKRAKPRFPFSVHSGLRISGVRRSPFAVKANTTAVRPFNIGR